MLVGSDVEVWDIVQEWDNVAVIYLTQEFWMRLDLMNIQIITSQHSPTWQDSNSHCRGNEQAFPISWEQMKQIFLGNTAVQGLSFQAENQQPGLLSAPGAEDSYTLNTPSRAARVPVAAAEDKWGRKQISSLCYSILTLGSWVWPTIHTWENAHTTFINKTSLCILKIQC